MLLAHRASLRMLVGNGGTSRTMDLAIGLESVVGTRSRPTLQPQYSGQLLHRVRLGEDSHDRVDVALVAFVQGVLERHDKLRHHLRS